MNNGIQDACAPRTFSQPANIQQGFMPERLLAVQRGLHALGISGTVGYELRDGVPQKMKVTMDAEVLLARLTTVQN